jgi:hypothetical protein
MALYCIGSAGSSVVAIQRRLKAFGNYPGPIDGVFGRGTAAAVRTFQTSNHLVVDGRVGEGTWAALFPAVESPAPACLASESVAYRCLALTGAFESSRAFPDCFAGISGNFDNQGLSLGVLQWNLGQGTVQRLLQKVDAAHPDILGRVFGENYPPVRAKFSQPRGQQPDGARDIQSPRFWIAEPWKSQFQALGREKTFQDIQVAFASSIFSDAQALCVECDLKSVHGTALMTDIKVQNGSISAAVKAQIQADVEQLDPALSPEQAEIPRMQIMANRRAGAASPEWGEDGRARKLTIANGEGTVHGRPYNLEADFAVGMASPEN